MDNFPIVNECGMMNEIGRLWKREMEYFWDLIQSRTFSVFDS